MLIITLISLEAVAGERKYKTRLEKSRSAEKVLTFMNQMGMHNSSLKEAASFVSERVEDGSIRFSEARLTDDTIMRFQYEFDRPSIENVQLLFKNDEMPNWALEGNPRELMVNYNISF